MKQSCYAVIIILGWTGRASADFLVDYGPPTGGLGHAISFKPDSPRPRLADDFVLPTSASITGMSFWSLETGGWNGTLEYFLFTDSGGLPLLTSFASGNAVNVSREITGTFSIGTQYKNSFEFESPILLSGETTYWVGLFMEPESPRDAIFWETTTQGIGSKLVRAEFSPEGPIWNPIGIAGVDQVAFQIKGIATPAPPSLVLCLIALPCIALWQSNWLRPLFSLLWKSREECICHTP